MENPTIDILVSALSYYLEDDGDGVVIEHLDTKYIVCKIRSEVSIVPLSEVLEDEASYEAGMFVKINIEIDE
jgi:hypothetical protein